MSDVFRYPTLLKKIIGEKGLSSNSVAKMCGLSPSTFSNYVTGYRTPDLYTAIKIADVLRLPESSLAKLFRPCN